MIVLKSSWISHLGHFSRNIFQKKDIFYPFLFSFSYFHSTYLTNVVNFFYLMKWYKLSNLLLRFKSFIHFLKLKCVLNCWGRKLEKKLKKRLKKLKKELFTTRIRLVAKYQIHRSPSTRFLTYSDLPPQFWIICEKSGTWRPVNLVLGDQWHFEQFCYFPLWWLFLKTDQSKLCILQ